MNTDIIDSLCTKCGLCCNGSLFDDVELSGQDEATKLEVMGLDVDIDERHLLLQPCSALQGTRCSIYTFRPGCCRTFECRLLQKTIRGDVNLDQAKATIASTIKHVSHMKELCKELGETEDVLPLKERCIEALSQPTDCDDEHVNNVRTELAESMDTMASIVHEQFLG